MLINRGRGYKNVRYLLLKAKRTALTNLQFVELRQSQESPVECALRRILAQNAISYSDPRRSGTVFGRTGAQLWQRSRRAERLVGEWRRVPELGKYAAMGPVWNRYQRFSARSARALRAFWDRQGRPDCDQLVEPCPRMDACPPAGGISIGISCRRLPAPEYLAQALASLSDFR
jgi:hypothetical protein